MNSQARGDLMLIVITIFWGASYILTKIGLEALQPFNLTALRFTIAFLTAAAVFKSNILRSDLRTIRYALILGIILFLVFISMTFGLKLTSASNAGFLISLSVVFIPILSFIFLNQRIERKAITGVCFAIVGVALLTLSTKISVNNGDVLCILCALLFAIHVVLTGVFTRKVDSIALGVLQLGFVGVFSIVFSALTETLRLPNTALSWFTVLALSIFCTAAGYIVQATAQRYTSATHTGIILSLEPVFSAIFAYAFLGEILSLRGYLGAFILLIGVLITEIDFKKIGVRKID